jgi:predicted alpha/beta superfamily hydrolase
MWLVMTAPPALAADTVRITFVVEAPESTPAGATLWISGNLPALGTWNGAGARLDSIGVRRFATTLALTKDAALEFKVTRGGWETVEKDASGGEIANHTHRATRDDTVRVVVGAWRDQVEGGGPRPSTLTGDIRRHPAFASRYVKPRDVLVYLPPGYDSDTTRRYPVLYFHDGNNVFDAATSFAGEWGVDETAERMIGAGELPSFIAVAVANTPDRMLEYTPAVDARHGGGRAADYARFLLEELMPFIDRTYRTRTDAAATGVVGSSLGGIVSLYLGLEHPDRFGLIGCVSPAAWWAGRDIVKRAASADARRGPARIWVDIGTAEETPTAGRRPWIDDARALRDALRRGGYVEGRSLHYEEVEGGRHNERDWAARTGRMLEFLLKPAAGD